MKVDLALFFIYFLSLFCISPSSSFPLFHSCPGSLAHKLCMPALPPPPLSSPLLARLGWAGTSAGERGKDTGAPPFLPSPPKAEKEPPSSGDEKEKTLETQFPSSSILFVRPSEPLPFFLSPLISLNRGGDGTRKKRKKV